MKPLIRYVVALAFLPGLISSCTEKEFDPADSEGSFAIAKEPYDDGSYEIALTRLGEFKARFPYSRYAVTAELLIADAYYQLSRFSEAAFSYSQFAKLHPKHEKVPFALYRVGDAYWQDAPEEVDREQALTSKSIAAWNRLVEEFPNDKHVAEAKKRMAEGRRRIAESQVFVAEFYCKQEIWHACAHRSLQVAADFGTYKDLLKISTELAGEALEEMAKLKDEDPESDSNLYAKNMSAEEMRSKARELKGKAAALEKSQ